MTRRQRIADLKTFELPEQPALSPDGSEVVYVLASPDAEADKVTRALWRVSTSGAGEPRRMTRGSADSSPAWSPDGTAIAFLRSVDRTAGGSTVNGAAQLWLLPADGGEPEQLTALPLGAGAPVWSPDGRKIAFGAPTSPVPPAAGSPMVADRLGYQADGAGLLGSIRIHLHVLDVESREVRQVTEGDWHAGPPAWSPDSARLAFSAATSPGADITYQAPVYVLDVSARHPVPEVAGLDEGIGGPVTWTADGTALLVVGMTGDPVGHAGLLRVPLGSGDSAEDGAANHSPAAGDDAPVVNLAAVLDRNVMPGGPGYPGGLPQLSADGQAVYFCVRDRGCTHVYRAPVRPAPADGAVVPEPVVTGAGRVVSGLSVAAGTAAIVLATPGSYGEVIAVDLESGSETVLTAHGAGNDEVGLFIREEREFTLSDGTTVPGWLVRDPAASGPQPLLLDIHGGPHNAWNGAADPVHLYHQELAARGWTVLLLNPRGSDGYGEAFFTAALGAWGIADANDFLEPLDQLVAEGVADAGRLAVTGYSYGGYMTCYLTSRDDRFAAAVAGGVVSDLVSMAGASDDGHLLAAHELGVPSMAGMARLIEMSPLSAVTSVTAPTLIVHGADDIRCPAEQAKQWHTALREQGVPTRLVLYPGASHLFILDGAPSHRIDWNQRTVDWVEQYTSADRRPPVDAAHWERRLAVLARRHKVPGAALGILRLRPGQPEELAEAAYGLLNADAGIEATTDSVWQIGSISKVWTATLAMQLADEGLLDLDTPVRDYLPDLQLADSEAAKSVTMRHLLTHTSGIDGDVFTDTGRGDDCLEKYAALLSDVKQNHPLNATWSYCNSGFSLAGRVIEKLTGKTWDATLREKILTPLGLAHTVTLPEEALLFRAAVGHVETDGKQHLAPVWTLPRSVGPAGLICSTPADVLAFARMHLSGGLAADGTLVLSADGARQMTEFQADVPDKYVLGDSWGIGWIRFSWDNRRLIGHDGNTIGQSAFLRVLLPSGGTTPRTPRELPSGGTTPRTPRELPSGGTTPRTPRELPSGETNGVSPRTPRGSAAGPDQPALAVVLLTNGGRARDLYQDLYAEIFAELAGVAMPDPIVPPASPVTASIDPHHGTYERAGVRIEVFSGDDGPMLRTTVLGPIAELTPDPVQEYLMTPLSPDLWVVREPEAQTWVPVTFYQLATGEKYVHFGARATPKAD